jgi:hypothetical protein
LGENNDKKKNKKKYAGKVYFSIFLSFLRFGLPMAGLISNLVQNEENIKLSSSGKSCKIPACSYPDEDNKSLLKRWKILGN